MAISNTRSTINILYDGAVSRSSIASFLKLYNFFFKIRITKSHLIQTLTIYDKTWIYWVFHVIIIKNKKKIESNLKCQKPDNLKSDNLISGKLAESDELFQLVSNLVCHITLSSSAVVAGLERTQWVSLSRGRRPRHSALLSCNIDDKFSHGESPVSTCSVCMMYQYPSPMYGRWLVVCSLWNVKIPLEVWTVLTGDSSESAALVGQ